MKFFLERISLLIFFNKLLASLTLRFLFNFFFFFFNIISRQINWFVISSKIVQIAALYTHTHKHKHNDTAEKSINDWRSTMVKRNSLFIHTNFWQKKVAMILFKLPRSQFQKQISPIQTHKINIRVDNYRFIPIPNDFLLRCYIRK